MDDARKITEEASIEKPIATDETPRVLIAEDDEISQILMHESMEQAGFCVEVVKDGEEAVTAFKRFCPDVVILDVMMPKMDGISVCCAIRNLPNGENVPVLMLTALDDVESIRRCFEAGATDFMTKPFNWMILQQRVLYMLRASRTFHRLCQSQARLTEAQRIAHLGNWEWVADKNLVIWSEETHHIFGLHPDEFDGTYDSLLKRIHPEDIDLFQHAMEAALNSGKALSIDHRILLPDGTERIVHLQAGATLCENGKCERVTGTVQDISERKQAEEKIAYLAYHDTLTGLPNRHFFKQHLVSELSRAKRKGSMLGLLFLDLDHLKRINDTFGHDAGDQLLSKVGERITNSVRVGDHLGRMVNQSSKPFVTRLGGDEFTVLLTDINRFEDAARVAQRIINALSEPFDMGTQEVFIGASIGITVYPLNGKDAETLLKQADSAMYYAKDMGRNNYQFYTESLNKLAFEHLALENRLRKALDNQEFSLYYQPQLDIKTGAIVGVEALIRWHQPEMGLVSPPQFIPLAEETGLIVPMGKWIIREACEQTKLWHEAGYSTLRVAVNLSCRQFKQKELFETISEALKVTGLDPNYLELELTESSVMQSTDEPQKMLNRLKEHGIRISIDDFGTGYSSLSYLKRFPIDTLKVDRSFIKDIPDDPDDMSITQAIIAMAKSLKMRVIAEGVETAEQLKFLQGLGCDGMQGYLFSPPVPADEMTRYLEERRCLYDESEDIIPLAAPA